MGEPRPRGIHLVNCLGTRLEFEDQSFEVSYTDDQITISRDAENLVVVRQKSGLFESESSIEGGVVLAEEQKGNLDYARCLSIDWDEVSLPELRFLAAPLKVERRYDKGHSIELGLEDVSEYQVRYRDGVQATFKRSDRDGFEFSFSTGFYGSFWKDADESYTLKFKGDRLEPTEDDFRSQSKFIVSRSKYSGNLTLILEDDATVTVG